MKVTATRPTYVDTAEGKQLLYADESAEVDGRQYRNHPFVECGYLLVEGKRTIDDMVASEKPEVVEKAQEKADHEFGNVPIDEVDEHAEADDLHELRAEFERVFGQAPHGRMKVATIRAKLDEASEAEE